MSEMRTGRKKTEGNTHYEGIALKKEKSVILEILKYKIIYILGLSANTGFVTLLIPPLFIYLFIFKWHIYHDE